MSAIQEFLICYTAKFTVSETSVYIRIIVRNVTSFKWFIIVM